MKPMSEELKQHLNSPGNKTYLLVGGPLHGTLRSIPIGLPLLKVPNTQGPLLFPMNGDKYPPTPYISYTIYEITQVMFSMGEMGKPFDNYFRFYLHESVPKSAGVDMAIQTVREGKSLLHHPEFNETYHLLGMKL